MPVDAAPAIELEPEDLAQADRDLGQQGMPGSMLYGALWFLIMATTQVAEDLPLLAWFGFFLLILFGLLRLAMGLIFERLHEADPDSWRTSYYTVVLSQAIVWGGLTAYLIWHYTTGWPAMLMSFVTAGIVAGGTISLSTRQTLQRIYIVTMLLPSAIACWATGDSGAMIMGILFAANIGFLLIMGHELDLGYWASMRNTRLLRRRASELQEARKKAESADRAKGQFVAKVSHELRTPLNGLIGTLSMLQLAQSPAKREKQLEIMSRSADLLLRRISEILDFSRMEAGKLELESIRMDPAVVVQDAVSLMQDAAAAKGLELSSSLKQRRGQQLLGDPSRLNQVLLNLISNAIKFTPAGTIRVQFEQEAEMQGRISCHFSVTDPGIGIPPNARQRIFESFEQADGSTTREYGGSGLGLAVSRDLVQLMGGRIRVNSEESKGSCFEFSINLPAAPAAEVEITTEERPAPAPVPSFGLHVLIAEDNAINQFIAEEMLAALACSSEVVDDGAACVSRFEHGNFDAILMDCEMPGVDGYEAARRIRELESASNGPGVPIIALTAHADDHNEQRTSKAGMTDFVTKPYTLEQLGQVLARQMAAASQTAS